MYKNILKRLLMMIPVLLGVSLIGFLLIYISPGDAVDSIVAQGGVYSEEDVMKLREEFGLDQPFFVQYYNYVKGIVTEFDFGTDYLTKRPVTSEILERFPTTLILACLGVLVAVIIGIPAGIISATKQYSLFDNIVTPISLIGVSMPGFWLGLLLIIAFSVKLGWLPASGFYGPEYWILPSITIGTSAAAFIMRMTRSSMLEVIRQDYIRTARAKGLSTYAVILKHALRNALNPVITAASGWFAGMLAGAVFIEYIFAWNGLGKAIVDALNSMDLPVVMGSVLVIASIFILINIFVDVIYAWLDPRIRTTK